MAQKLEVEINAKSNVEATLGKIEKSYKNFGNEIAGRIAGAAGATVLFDKALTFLTDTMREFKEIADAAARSGLSGEQFQQLAYAADQAGVPISSVAKATRELRKALAEAADGSVEQMEKLKALGFTEEQIRSGNIKATDVFIQLAAAMQMAKSDAEQVAIATSLLGQKVAQDLIPMLAEGAQKLRQLFKEAPILSDKELENIKKAADLFAFMEAKAKSIAASMVTAFLGMSGLPGFLEGPIGVFRRQIMRDLGIGRTESSPMTGKVDVAKLTKEPTTAAEKKADKDSKTATAQSVSGNVIGVGQQPVIAAMNEQIEILKDIRDNTAKGEPTQAPGPITSKQAQGSVAAPSRAAMITKKPN